MFETYTLQSLERIERLLDAILGQLQQVESSVRQLPGWGL